MKLLIIQTSLHQNSKTAIAAEFAYHKAQEQGLDAEFLDLRNYDVQMCTGGKIESYNQDMQKIKEKVEQADMYILAYPVYNYSFSGVCKNFIDIFSYYMDGKKCGIIHNSYSPRSFSDGFGELSRVLGLHNNVDIILPVTHTTHTDFDENVLVAEKPKEKILTLLSIFKSL